MKDATKWMWGLGDYGEVATFLEPHAEALADAAGLRPGVEVLDVAAGNGNFAIAAARRGARVIASDLTPRMLELGRARTQADGYSIDWVEADAEQLPFSDGRFDVVASVFGAMFAPRPDRVTAELFRVVKPGGGVAMANYAHRGFLGSFADVLGRFSMAPPGGMELPSPFTWGDPAEVRRRFDGRTASLRVETRTVTFSFPSLEAGWAFWERTNPPLMALKAMLPSEKYPEVQAAGADLMRQMNSAQDGGLRLDSDYLSVLAIRRRD
ncbi:MAG TPA: class I SAM-dependent methyltransferase [Candidatus Acidoferrum sp.]|nr:class I SAM-dependent methyltransferase [Candidatus Acidoferrum sp.]